MKSLIDYRNDTGERRPLDLGALVAPPPELEGGRGVGNLSHAVRRHWRLAVVATLLIGILATLVALSIPDRYRSWAAVLIEEHPAQVLNTGSVVPDSVADSLAVDSEVQVLRSPALAAQIIDRLHLANYPEFRDGLLVGPLGRLFGGGHATRTELIDRFLQGLSVVRQEGSRVIQVSFTDRDSNRAAAIVNALVGSYLADEVARKVEATRNANGLLDQKLAQLRADVDAKEEAVEAWRTRSGLVRGAQAPAIDEQVSQTDTALAVAREDLAQAQARLASAAGGASSAVVSNLLIQHLREREADIERRIAELSVDLGPRHPVMINLQAELTTLRATIGNEVGKIDQTLREQQDVAAARVAELTATLHRLRAQSGSDNAAQVKLHALQREADASRAVLDTFLRRYDETAEEAALQQPNARVLGTAEPPTRPVFPSRKAMLGFGWLIALGIGGLGLPALREALGHDVNPLMRIEVIERAAGPALAVIPAVPGGSRYLRHPYDRMIDDPHGEFAEAIRSARTSLLFARAEHRCKIVLLTSATAGEGKTVLATSIARSAALAGEDTLLVDVNLRNPALHEALDLSNERGLVDYLENGLDIEALIQIDPRSPLEVMTAGRMLPQTPPLLSLAALTRLFDDLRTRYRLVILDGSALLDGSESRYLASAVDEVVLVARADLSQQALSFALRQVNEAHVASVRVLINRVDLPALQEEAAAFG